MGYISDLLNEQINDRRERINQYYADIDRYNQGISDAKEAISHFESAHSEMSGLIVETGNVFKGDAAEEFLKNLNSYNRSIQEMIPIMQKRIESFKRRIKEIEKQIQTCKSWMDFLNDCLSIFKPINF